MLRHRPPVADVEAGKLGLSFLFLRAGATIQGGANRRQQVFDSSLCHAYAISTELSIHRQAEGACGRAKQLDFENLLLFRLAHLLQFADEAIRQFL